MNDLPDRFPRGWFVLGHQRDFPVGETKTIFGFNNKILISRSEDGSVAVDVGGDTSWPVLEINQMVMVWHDVEKQGPDFTPDKIEECYSDDWSDYGMASFIVKNNCRELIDNMADKGHFGPVHQAPFEGFWNEAKNHTYTQEMTADSPILGRDLFSQARYEGPAYMTTYMSAVHDGAKVESRLLVSHIPLTLTSFVINFGVMVKKVPGMSAEDEAAFIQGYVDANNYAFGQDVAIWENKIYIPDPVVCDGDGPLHKLRKWYGQFLVNRADIPSGLDLEKENFNFQSNLLKKVKLSLDDLDHKILQILEEDGRAPAKFIAEKLSVNEVTVSKRLAKIIDGGFCKIIAIADFEKCGYDHLLPIGIRVQGDKLEEVAEVLSQQKEVFSVNVVSGIQDIEILCATQSLDETKVFLDETLPSIVGIKSIAPAIASNVYKFETDWTPFLQMKLDQTDKKIIQLLGADARMSNNQMAKVIGVTEGTVRNRIQKLIKNRVIKISVINNINRMENPSLAFVGLDVETRAKDSVAKALSKMKEVRFVSSLIGRHDLMAFVLAEDVTKLSKVLYEEISSLPGVRFSESSIGLKYYKYDYRWARILD